MFDPVPIRHYHGGHRFETWFPEGILDINMATFMAHYLGFEEAVADEPFHRFVDLSKLTAIRLDFNEVATFAAQRIAAYEDGPPVKSAFLAISPPAYAVARMFAALMEPSPIDVRVFRNVQDSAEWLGIPVESLQEDS